MTEMTVNRDPTIFSGQGERLLGFLQAASTELQEGRDAEGIKSLLSALSELEQIVENDQNSLRPQIDWSRLLPAAKTLYFYIKNQDITGIIDLINDAFCPMAEEWTKGSDGR